MDKWTIHSIVTATTQATRYPARADRHGYIAMAGGRRSRAIRYDDDGPATPHQHGGEPKPLNFEED